MIRMKNPLVLAALLASLGTTACAQTQPIPVPMTPQGQSQGVRPEGGRFDPAKRQQWRAERVARRLADLRQQLQIAPQQEAAWTAWAQAMQPVNLQRPSREEFARLTTPERIDRRRALRTQRIAAMDKRMDATKTFYAALTPEQKKMFDERGARRGRDGRHGGPGGDRR